MSVLYFVLFVSHTRLDLSLVFVEKFKFILMKMHKNFCHQNCSFWLIYAPNRLLAGTLPQTLLGELTALPQNP